MRILLITLSLLLATFALRAQANLDSFYAIWDDKEQSDSIRMEAIDNVIREFSYNNIDTSLFYANLMYEEAKELGLKKHQGNAMHRLAWCYWVRSDFPKMEEHLAKSYSYAKESEDQHGIARYYGFMGDIKSFFGDQDSAYIYLNKAIELTAYNIVQFTITPGHDINDCTRDVVNNRYD